MGMGEDLAEVCAERLAQADEILGWSVMAACLDEEKLKDTRYTQPCLYVIESAIADLLAEKGHQPSLVAGHSLGEYSALYAAGVFDFASGLHLVKRRAELMSEASEGAMAAIMGFKRDELDAKIAETEGVVLANDNNPMQVVVSGTPEAVETVMNEVKAKRTVKLKVGGAFHSPLMADAAAAFESILTEVDFSDAKVPVMSNVDPVPETDAKVLKARLSEQMTGAVRWREISLGLPEHEIEMAVEIGPGKVLTGLIKKTCRGMGLKNVDGVGAIANY